MIDLDRTFYTKSLNNDIPLGAIHYYLDGDRTLCGRTLNQRWIIETSAQGREITCKQCLKIKSEEK